MKHAFFFLFLSLTVNAAEIRVKKVQQDGDLERSLVLKTNLSEKVVLDCQSFIQGLRIGEFETAETFLMDPDDCMDLQKRIRGSLRRFQSHCIDVDDYIRTDYTCH
jgi:hypothetical protein